MADCCDDFTRSHLLRASVARAGAGLPVTEPGMPTPAGTGLTRRSMLLRSAGLALAVYGAGRALTPEAFEAAVAEAAGEQKVLISIFMDGGVDALSLLAPTGDPRYVDPAPDARAAAGAGWAFEADARLRWHPSAGGLKELWDDPGCGVAVAPAIGYDSPNQSHFTSRHFWEVGATDPDGVDRLARAATSTASAIPTCRSRGSRWTTPCRRSWRRAASPSPPRATSATTSSTRSGVWGQMQTRMRDDVTPRSARCARAIRHGAGAPGAGQLGRPRPRPGVGGQRAPRRPARLPGRGQHLQGPPAGDRAACSPPSTARATTCRCAA